MSRETMPLTLDEIALLRPWFLSGEDADYPFRTDYTNMARRSGGPTELEDRLLVTLDANSAMDEQWLADALHAAGVGCVYFHRMVCGPLDNHLPRPFHVSQARAILAQKRP